MKLNHIDRDYLDRCYNLAVLGGTFDPIHLGHIAIALSVYEQYKPQRILFMPCAQPPHKHSKRVTNAKHRLHMAALASCEHPVFDVSQLEINRPGLSFTIDTARALKALCPTGAEISFIIGVDAFADILNWKDSKELLATCQFIVTPRPGYDNEKAQSQIEEFIKTYNAKIKWLDGPLLDISSTNIRERLRTGMSVQGLLPKWVEDYALWHGLYRDEDAPPLAERFDEAVKTLQVRLSPKRFKHTMGVVEEALRLANCYDVNKEKARWAALLHDCAKEYSSYKKHTLSKLWRIELDEILVADIDIAHGLIGAESARRDFLVDDDEILQAIRYHTTGHKAMTMLDKIIMLADYIEPYRDDWGPIKEMRELASTDINKALILGTNCTIKETKNNRRQVHPWSIDALKQLKKQKEKKDG